MKKYFEKYSINSHPSTWLYILNDIKMKRLDIVFSYLKLSHLKEPKLEYKLADIHFKF